MPCIRDGDKNNKPSIQKIEVRLLVTGFSAVGSEGGESWAATDRCLAMEQESWWDGWNSLLISTVPFCAKLERDRQ